MRNRYISLFICIALMFYAFAAFAADSPSYIFDEKVKKAEAEIESIPPRTLMDWIRSKKDFVLLDVREQSEVEAGKIETKNTMHTPRGLLDIIASKGAIKTDQTIVVYCKKGSRGLLAAAMLKELGFQHVYNLEGGIHGWMEAGLPITNSLGTFKAVPFDLTGCAEGE